MKRISGTLLAVLAIGAGMASTAALAENPIGFYVGAGVGESTIRSDDPAYGYPGYYNDHQTAFKGIVGIRPISPMGLEADYIDFGEPGYHHGSYDTRYYGEDSHPRAAVLFALGYLPIPLPYIDIYAKAGAARLKTIVNTTCNSAIAVCSTLAPGSIVRNGVTDTKFAYGAGVQSKFAFGLTVRAEYERISSSYGDPDALMVSALFSF